MGCMACSQSTVLSNSESWNHKNLENSSSTPPLSFCVPQYVHLLTKSRSNKLNPGVGSHTAHRLKQPNNRRGKQANSIHSTHGRQSAPQQSWQNASILADSDLSGNSEASCANRVLLELSVHCTITITIQSSESKVTVHQPASHCSRHIKDPTAYPDKACQSIIARPGLQTPRMVLCSLHGFPSGCRSWEPIAGWHGCSLTA